MIRARAVNTEYEDKYRTIIQAVREGRDIDVDVDELLLTRIRLGVSRREIRAEDVQILFEGQIVTLTPYGQLNAWPNRMHDAMTTMLLAILAGPGT